MLSSEAIKLLEIVEKTIDEQNEENYDRQWKEFLDHNGREEMFFPKRIPQKVDYQYKHININDAVKDKNLMLIEQMERVLKWQEKGWGALGVRCNYGTGILSSLYGCDLFIMPYEQNTLPSTLPMRLEKVQKAMENGTPSLFGGLGSQVFEMGEFFLEAFEKYPKIKKYVSLYHPDLQGPLDIAELLLGEDLFYLPYDNPELLHKILQNISGTYTLFMEKWFKLAPKNKPFSHHWQLCFNGNILLRDDSAMNFAPEQVKEFALDYDEKLLAHFGGGALHFCGKGDHFCTYFPEMKHLYGVNIGQPHLNDMELMCQRTVDIGIQILGIGKGAAMKYANRQGCYHHNLAMEE